MNTILRHLFSLLFFFIVSFAVNAQERVVYGKVVDYLYKQPVIGCSIFPLKAGLGATTDSSGLFKLKLPGKSDSIIISSVGYNSTRVYVPKKIENGITIELVPLETAMGEVIIARASKYTKAQWLVKQAIERKEQNNIFNNASLQATIYDKLELDVKNLPKIIRNNALLKPMQFVINNADSSGGFKKIPLYLAESFSNYTYKKEFDKERYDYTAMKNSSFDNKTIMDFLGNKSILAYVDKQYKKVNVYKNFINIADVNFISPIADIALKTYKFKILDTVQIDNHQYFKVAFKPLKYGSYAFNGFMWIADSVYAIHSYVMDIDSTANLNFVNKFEISQYFLRDSADRFLPEKNILYLDLILPGKQKSGAIATKTTMYKDIFLNNTLVDTVFEKPLADIDDLNKKETDWASLRYEPLTKSENAVFELMDTLNKLPAVIKNVKYIVALSSGFFTVGKVDFGNFYNTYRRNFIEGQRINFGFRTNSTYNNELQFAGYGGYAFKDKQIRYNLGITEVLNNTKWTTLKLSISNEISQFSTNDDVQGQLSFLSTIFNRVPLENMRLINRKDATIQYRRFFTDGLAVAASVKNSVLTPYFDVYYKDANFSPYLFGKPETLGNYKVNEATVSIRYSYKEKYVTQLYNRTSLGSMYPFVTLSYTKGIKINDGVLASDFNYSRWNLNIQHDFTNGLLGLLSYNINAGFTNGLLPSVLLEVPPGNDSYIFNSSAFNNMNRFEFVTDKYVRLLAQQSFGNFPFRFFPLLKKLKWETLVTFNGMIGGMSEANKIANGYYDTTTSYHFTVPDKTPYFEVGVGMAKIFRLLRIDAIWRLNYLNNPNIPKFGIKASLEFKL